MTARVKPIIRGADWRALFECHYTDANGVDAKLDWLNYDLDCDFKHEQGVDKPVVAKPEIAVIDNTLLQLSLTEAQTTALAVADIYFNVLATAPYQQQRKLADGTIVTETKLWTGVPIRGKIKVQTGTTNPMD
ncbi:MAG: hypothetical protein CR977_02500 [Gammaproteobacteria bacterium]|nr:MAG: hypothetical protein CR977_02500 [Gammaproteobacteria bacterium]